MSIGLKEGTVRLVPHNPEWKNLAQALIEKLWSIFQDDAAEIRHVGSTSIEGICAKPIIDISVAVWDLAVIHKYMDDLRQIGLCYRGEMKANWFIFDVFLPGSDICTYHVHVVYNDSLAWHNYQNFRDYLNAFPDEAKKYEALKIQLAQQHADCRSNYTKSKEEFIKTTLRKAAEWRKGQSE